MGQFGHNRHFFGADAKFARQRNDLAVVFDHIAAAGSQLCHLVNNGRGVFGLFLEFILFGQIEGVGQPGHWKSSAQITGLPARKQVLWVNSGCRMRISAGQRLCTAHFQHIAVAFLKLSGIPIGEFGVRRGKTLVKQAVHQPLCAGFRFELDFPVHHTVPAFILGRTIHKTCGQALFRQDFFQSLSCYSIFHVHLASFLLNSNNLYSLPSVFIVQIFHHTRHRARDVFSG